jgi:hypothetical protein
MAVVSTAQDIGAQLPARAVRFLINTTSADASGGEVIKAAGGAGISHYITRVWLAGGEAETFTIGSGDDADAAVEVAIIGPCPSFTPLVYDFRDCPIKIAANKAILLDASGADPVCVVVEGATL